jgi:hypothetical protein
VLLAVLLELLLALEAAAPPVPVEVEPGAPGSLSSLQPAIPIHTAASPRSIRMTAEPNLRATSVSAAFMLSRAPSATVRCRLLATGDDGADLEGSVSVRGFLYLRSAANGAAQRGFTGCSGA